MASLIKGNNRNYTIVYHDFERRRWKSTFTSDHEEAQRIFDLLVPNLERSRKTSLSYLAHRIDEYTKANLSGETAKMYSRTFRMLQSSLGDLPLRNITTLNIEKFKQDRLKHVLPVTVNIDLRTLRSAFNLAVDWGLMDQNPAKRCKLLRIPQIDHMFLSKSEFLNLCSSINDEQFRRLLLLAVRTGMRRGEIVNLCWEDMDFTRKSIRIRNRQTFVVKGMRPRTIPMPEDIWQHFQTLSKTSGYVFTKVNGSPLSAHSVSRRFKRLLRICGLPQELHFHSLRRTYASWLALASAPIHDIQRLLGHQNVQTTELYITLPSEHLRQSASRVELPEVLKRTG